MHTAGNLFFQLSYTFRVISAGKIIMTAKRKVYMTISPSFVFLEDHAQVPMMATYNPLDHAAYKRGMLWLRPKAN